MLTSAARRVWPLAVLVLVGAAVVTGGSITPHPRFTAYLSILPDEETPRDGDGRARYVAVVTVNGSEPEFEGGVSKLHFSAGQKATETRPCGAYVMVCEVGVEASGDRAAAVVEVIRDDVPVMVQRFAVWLPVITAG